MYGNTDQSKSRHGCLTAWLSLMLIGNALTALLYVFEGNVVMESFPGEISYTMVMLLTILGFANVACAFLMLKWKKIGFWGFLVTSFLTLIVNLNVGLSIGQALLGLIGIGILFGVLQIKQDGESGWENLE